MNKTHDPLNPYPLLRSLRDAILVRDPEAREASEGFVTRVLLAAALHVRLPPDRLVTTDDAARLLGLDRADFDQLAYRSNLRPVHVLAKNCYWRVSDVYSLVP
jgi:hypothetical protein